MCYFGNYSKNEEQFACVLNQLDHTHTHTHTHWFGFVHVL